MSRNAVVAQKSPLHPSALRLQDLTPGLTVIQFNIEYGDMGTYAVLGYPRVVSTDIGNHVMIPVRRESNGYTDEQFANDMGIIPYGGAHPAWNDRNFTIDHRKRHLLPKSNPSLRKPWFEWHDDNLYL